MQCSEEILSSFLNVARQYDLNSTKKHLFVFFSELEKHGGSSLSGSSPFVNNPQVPNNSLPGFPTRDCGKVDEQTQDKTDCSQSIHTVTQGSTMPANGECHDPGGDLNSNHSEGNDADGECHDPGSDLNSNLTDGNSVGKTCVDNNGSV